MALVTRASLRPRCREPPFSCRRLVPSSRSRISARAARAPIVAALDGSRRVERHLPAHVALSEPTGQPQQCPASSPGSRR